MLTGAHSIIYSTNAEADRAFLKSILKLPAVDAGDGWLIFGLPPSEVAVHPSDKNDLHQLYLMVDDVAVFVSEMRAAGIACAPINDRGWGLLTELTLPGGGKLGVYEPRHPSPEPLTGKKDKKGKKEKKRDRAKKADDENEKKAAKKVLKLAKKADKKSEERAKKKRS